jgi:putative endonuclease
MSRAGFTYMISNYERTVIYIGVTNNIYKRMLDYKNNLGGYFASKYKCKYLVYYENFQAIGDAIAREKQLKNWHKDWKWNLVKTNNPELNDLSADWFTHDNQLKDPGLAIQHLRGF